MQREKEGITIMSRLTGTFSTATASAPAAFLDASLDLLVADTRRGMDARTQQAYLQVSAAAGSNARRADYLAHYKEAAGKGPLRRAPTNSGPKPV